jgi:hypothetical protein
MKALLKFRVKSLRLLYKLHCCVGFEVLTLVVMETSACYLPNSVFFFLLVLFLDSEDGGQCSSETSVEF